MKPRKGLTALQGHMCKNMIHSEDPFNQNCSNTLSLISAFSGVGGFTGFPALPTMGMSSMSSQVCSWDKVQKNNCPKNVVFQKCYCPKFYRPKFCSCQTQRVHCPPHLHRWPPPSLVLASHRSRYLKASYRHCIKPFHTLWIIINHYHTPNIVMGINYFGKRPKNLHKLTF